MHNDRPPVPVVRTAEVDLNGAYRLDNLIAALQELVEPLGPDATVSTKVTTTVVGYGQSERDEMRVAFEVRSVP